jgi:hypothetical protein
MRKGGGKSKGSSFERKIAKELGHALFNDKDSFVRTPSSGALATIRKSKAATFAGDIMQVDHVDQFDFPFCIECKHYKAFDPWNLLTKKKNSLEYKAWEQAIENATKSNGKYPLLIFRANNRPVYAAFSEVFLLGGGANEMSLTVGNYEGILVTTFEDFLKLFETEQLRSIILDLCKD